MFLGNLLNHLVYVLRLHPCILYLSKHFCLSIHFSKRNCEIRFFFSLTRKFCARSNSLPLNFPFAVIIHYNITRKSENTNFSGNFLFPRKIFFSRKEQPFFNSLLWCDMKGAVKVWLISRAFSSFGKAPLKANFDVGK